MRLIDADAAIKDARLNYGDVHDAVLMEHFLNSQPMVEVVVKCKDCTHYGDVGDCEVHPHDGRFNREYFCADGEYKNPEQLPNAPLTLQELREIYDGE
jgi:hypothetical protein